MARRKRRRSQKWSRIGQQIADFWCGLILSVLSHVCHAIIIGIENMYRLIEGAVLWAMRKTRKKPPSQISPSGPVPKDNAQSPQFQPSLESPNVYFKDVVGLDDAKQEVELRMILPSLHPEKAKLHGIRQGGGLLLYGPPGTGKTMLAKAAATELEAVFYHIRPSDIMSGNVGQAEKNIAALFGILRQEKRAVLFIDEIESLIPARKRNSSTIMQRVISQFLSEVDGFQENDKEHSLFLIGATNEPGMIDPAMLRPGRFDSKIYVGPPGPAAREQLIKSLLISRQVDNDMNIRQVVEKTKGLTGAEIKEVLNKAADNAFLCSIKTKQPQQITLERILQCLKKLKSSI